MALKIVRAKDKASIGYLRAALMGKAGSGKTLTMLLWAEYLASLDPKGRGILFCDTENGAKWYREEVPERTVHPHAFKFDWLQTRSLFDVIEALTTLADQYSVICVDSVSHLWQAAQEAYSGKRTSGGGVPIQGWGILKRPWHRFIQLGINGDFHFLFAGREGVLMDTGDDGEMRVTGVKMRAESEAQFEPDLLGHMQPEQQKDGTQLIRVMFVKDRSGILAGRRYDWPSAETIRPLVAYLGGEQPKVDDLEAAAEKDAGASEAEADRKEIDRTTLVNQIREAINRSRDLPELRVAWELTKGKKMKLGDEAMTALEADKDARKMQLLGSVA